MTMITVKREEVLADTLEFNDELLVWEVMLTCSAKVRARYIVLSLSRWYFDVVTLVGCLKDCEECIAKEPVHG